MVKDDKILGVPIDGSQPRVVSTTRVATTGVTTRDGDLYWVDRNSAAGAPGGRSRRREWGVPSSLEATDAETLLTQAITTTSDAVYVLLSLGPVQYRSTTTRLAVDETSVYWSTSDGTIKKIAK